MTSGCAISGWMAGAALAALIPAALQFARATPAASEEKACAQTDTGITLPKGFCATVFADGIGHARQLAVAPDGTL